jgi:Na+/H+ antiporter NhaD/arsenite permease-like protein
MLAYNIWLAASQGMNVSPGVEDILVQLREARTRFEERKRLNSESVRMIAFLVPGLYIGTVLLSVKFLGMTAAKFLRNQFGNPEGFLLFTFIVLLFFVNSIIVELATHKRLDY